MKTLLPSLLKMKKIIILIFLFPFLCNAQYGNYYKHIVKAVPFFKFLTSTQTGDYFLPIQPKGYKIGDPVRHSFNLHGLQLKYCYPESASDSGCGYFIFNKQRFNLRGRFEYNFACELDEASFDVYQGSFNGHKYILLTCINNGSNTYAMTVICNLFDITNKKAIKYYPLWSMFGSEFSFGDFNNDGKLDFLQSRYEAHYQGDYDILKLTLLTLKNGKFKSDNNKYITVRRTGNSLKVLNRKWFN